MRKLYVGVFATLGVPVYDGMAPASANGKYAVITDTSFGRAAIKQENYCEFTVSIDIYQEFKENSNSEGVDATGNAMLEIILPLSSKSYLPMDGFRQNDVRLQNIANDAYQSSSVTVTHRKRISILHLLNET